MTADHEDGRQPAAHGGLPAAASPAASVYGRRERALAALRRGQFDLAEAAVASGELTLSNLIETLHIYQAELEIQNEELRQSQSAVQAALTRFTGLFRTLPIAELVADPQGLIIDANPVACELLGLRDPHYHHRFLARLIHEDDRSRLLGIMNRLRDGEDAVLPEVRLLGTGQGPLLADLHIARLALEATDRSRFVCALLDRTDAVRQREALRDAYARIEHSEALLVATGRQARIGAWEFDLGAARLRWTVITRELHEVGPDFEPSIERATAFYHPDDRRVIRAALAAALRDGTPYELELRLSTAKGRSLWVKTTAEPIRGEGDHNGLGQGPILGLRGSIQDVTSRIEAEQARRENEQRYRALFESAAEGLSIIQDERFVSINRAGLKMLGYDTADAVLGRRPWDISPPHQPCGESSESKARELLQGAHGGRGQRFEWEHQRADGSILPVEVTLIPVQLAGRQSLFVVWADLTERRAAEHRELRARVVFDNTSEGIVVTDSDQRILAVNRAFSEITGYSEEEALGATPRLVQSGRHDAAFYQALWMELNETGNWRGEIWNRRKNGEIYAQLTTISAVRDQAERLTHYVAVFGDITHIKRSEEALYRLAHHDALTGLPNRTLLRARLEQALQRAQRTGRMVGVLFIDLDLFKTVNDTLGHTIGDALLVQVAQAMAARVRDADSIARLGGDEFVVLAEDIDKPSAAALLSQRLLEIFSKPFDIEGRELYITASIGISFFPGDGRDMDSLLSNADVAMYRAKASGRNTYRFFEPRMTAGAMERLQLETALRGALPRGELTLHYQPQVRLGDGCMHGAEVLLRWNYPRLGDVSPRRFIPIAEELGLINELGAWVVGEACRQLSVWEASGLLLPRLSLNLSVAQLERPSLVEEICAILARTGVRPNRLELEVTESMLMRHTDQVIANLQALKELGVTIAVDDFGTGYSSLGYLKQLPIERLKIDKTFIDGLPNDPNDEAIARSIIALGRGLGLDVIAEGVETREQAAWLEREGCSEAQGFFFGRPMTAEQLLEHKKCP